MGEIIAVCLSEKKGTAKVDAGKAELVVNHGVKGDAHAGGDPIRQVSLLADEKIKAFNAAGAGVEYGAFGENLVIGGVDLATLPVGTRLRAGRALLEITQHGKQCHSRCAIYERMGDCIMPREGVFAKVLEGGEISVGDEIDVC